jgi:hypothetical protein
MTVSMEKTGSQASNRHRAFQARSNCSGSFKPAMNRTNYGLFCMPGSRPPKVCVHAFIELESPVHEAEEPVPIQSNWRVGFA